MTGSLTVYTGSMYSGKTMHMLNDIVRWIDAHRNSDVFFLKPLIINSVIDTRDENNEISSNSSLYRGIPDSIDVVKVNSLSEVDVENRHIIGINECQLFDDLYEKVKMWVLNGKIVYCAGLDSDYMGEKYGHVSELLHLADTFIKLPAICSLCLNEMISDGPIKVDNLPKAGFTAKCIKSHRRTEVGGADKYKAVCRKHLEWSWKEYGHK